jgi:CrcB protein
MVSGGTTVSPFRPRHPDASQLIDPDVDLHDPAQRAEAHHAVVLAAVAAGGVIGAECRYALGLLIAHGGRALPWSTVAINVSGCLLIGVLMVLLLDGRPASHPAVHPLARPFLGTGILGGYTTFSTFAADVDRLVRAGRPGIALLYLLITVLGCAAAVWLATALTRAAIRHRRAETVQVSA